MEGEELPEKGPFACMIYRRWIDLKFDPVLMVQTKLDDLRRSVEDNIRRWNHKHKRAGGWGGMPGGGGYGGGGYGGGGEYPPPGY